MLKRYFVLPYLLALFVVFLYSLYQVILEGERSAIFLLIAVSPMLFFMMAVALFDTARTKRHLFHELIAGVAVSIAALYWADWQTALACFVLGAVGVAIYDFWYSPLTRLKANILAEGNLLPEVSFYEDSESKSSKVLTEKPAVWLFVRGNWCPLCVAQVKELAASYQKIHQLGVDVFVISAQSSKEIAKMAESLSVPLRFLEDKNLQAAKQLGVLHEGGTPAGIIGFDADTIMPTVLITKAGGEIFYSDLTSNYRVRPEPQALLEQLKKLKELSA